MKLYEGVCTDETPCGADDCPDCGDEAIEARIANARNEGIAEGRKLERADVVAFHRKSAAELKSVGETMEALDHEVNAIRIERGEHVAGRGSDEQADR